MIRYLAIAGLAALSAAMQSPAAFAEPVMRSAMPAISASVKGNELTVRLAEGVIGHTDASRLRTIIVEARDASGQVIGTKEEVVRKWLSYATVTLPAELASAASLGVSVN